MGFVRPSRALRTNWPHAADIRTRMDGTGEARSASTGLSIKLKSRHLQSRVPTEFDYFDYAAIYFGSTFAARIFNT